MCVLGVQARVRVVVFFMFPIFPRLWFSECAGKAYKRPKIVSVYIIAHVSDSIR